MDSVGFDGVEGLILGDVGRATTALQRYFSGGEDSSFTGRWFEQFSRATDPDRLDANDVAACGALSVELSGKVIDRLWSSKDQINELLSRAPGRDATLAEVDLASDEMTALGELYALLRSLEGVGYVTASKLLACKRPALVPIRDSVVEHLLATGKAWWAPWQQMVRSEGLAKAVNPIEVGSTVGPVTLLRRLDVILWMYGSGKA